MNFLRSCPLQSHVTSMKAEKIRLPRSCCAIAARSLRNWLNAGSQAFVLLCAQILEQKAQRLEQLVKLKDAKLHALSLHLQRLECGD